MDNSRICHRLLFHERGKQYFVAASSSVNEATKGTHTLSLNFTLELWGEFLALIWVSIMHGLTWSVLSQLQCVICTVSSLPLSVMVCSCHACVVFVPRTSFTLTLRSGSSPSPTCDSELVAYCHERARMVSWNIYIRSFKIYGMCVGP